jgi:hypothetical protein
MTAPTSAVQKLQKDLANGAPSTHDPTESMRVMGVGFEIKATAWLRERRDDSAITS